MVLMGKRLSFVEPWLQLLGLQRSRGSARAHLDLEMPTWTWRCSRSYCLSSATYRSTRLILKGISAPVNMMETQTACIRELYLIFTKLTITLSSLNRIVCFCFSVSQKKTPHPPLSIKSFIPLKIFEYYFLNFLLHEEGGEQHEFLWRTDNFLLHLFFKAFLWFYSSLLTQPLIGDQ